MAIKLEGYCEGCRCFELPKPIYFADKENGNEIKCHYSYMCERAYKKGQEKNDFAQEIIGITKPMQTRISEMESEMKGFNDSIKRNSVFMILEAACVLFLAISHLLGG